MRSPLFLIPPGSVPGDEDLTSTICARLKAIWGLMMPCSFLWQMQDLGWSLPPVKMVLILTDIRSLAAAALAPSIYWGTGYSWVNSDDDNYDKLTSWSLGLMFRRRYFSTGITARDLNRPRFHGEKLGRTYDFGVAIRPSTSRITFSVDARKVEKIKGLDFNFAVEVRPFRWMALRGSVNDDSSFDLRFGVNFRQFGVGVYNRFDENQDYQRTVGYMSLSQALHTTRHIRRNAFLDVQMSARLKKPSKSPNEIEKLLEH